MSSNGSKSVDGIIQELIASDNFLDNDLSNVAHISPFCYEQRCIVKAKISLKRVENWQEVSSHVTDKENAISVCLMAMDSREHLEQARTLLQAKPSGLLAV